MMNSLKADMTAEISGSSRDCGPFSPFLLLTILYLSFSIQAVSLLLSTSLWFDLCFKHTHVSLVVDGAHTCLQLMALFLTFCLFFPTHWQVFLRLIQIIRGRTGAVPSFFCFSFIALSLSLSLSPSAHGVGEAPGAQSRASLSESLRQSQRPVSHSRRERKTVNTCVCVRVKTADRDVLMDYWMDLLVHYAEGV